MLGKYLSCLLLLWPLSAFLQELPLKGEGYGGMLSVGARTTASLFNGHEDESNGLGVGGQFRLQFANRLNTDWFFDYLNSNIGDYAERTDYHIGWSVIYYPTKNQSALVRPYVLAGHCFDQTYIRETSNPKNQMDRFSSAVQGGAGIHFNLSPRLDLSFVGQYMIHLGGEIHAHKEDGVLTFHEDRSAKLEGHLLLHVGINYKLVDLW